MKKTTFFTDLVLIASEVRYRRLFASAQDGIQPRMMAVTNSRVNWLLYPQPVLRSDSQPKSVFQIDDSCLQNQ